MFDRMKVSMSIVHVLTEEPLPVRLTDQHFTGYLNNLP